MSKRGGRHGSAPRMAVRDPRLRALLRLARPALGVLVLAVLVARLGPAPLLDAVRSIDAAAIVTALVIGLVTTLCCAWRWSTVGGALGLRITVRGALSACYRAQLVNVATPGGVAGDVLRGVDRGRRDGDTSLGLRSVGWERLLGQVVQVSVALGALVVLPSPVPRLVVLAVIASGLVAALGIGLLRRVRGSGRARSAGRRPARWAAEDASRVLRTSVLTRAATASALVVAGLVLLFVVAAHAAGAHASMPTLVPLALVVLLGSAVPANLAGWGPREGVAAWSFGAAGLGPDQGLATAVVFGLLVLVASLPGAVLLLLPRPLTTEVHHA